MALYLHAVCRGRPSEIKIIKLIKRKSESPQAQRQMKCTLPHTHLSNVFIPRSHAVLVRADWDSSQELITYVYGTRYYHRIWGHRPNKHLALYTSAEMSQTDVYRCGETVLPFSSGEKGKTSESDNFTPEIIRLAFLHRMFVRSEHSA